MEGKAVDSRPWFVAQLLLSPLQQFIEFVDELLKSDVVFFFFDQSAQLVHAFTFFRSHAVWDGCGESKVYARDGVFPTGKNRKGSLI